MSLLKDQVTKYNSDKNRIIVAYDLSLNQSMYCVPKEIIKNLEDSFPIFLDPVNCPDIKRVNYSAEIYWGNRIELDMIDLMPKLKWVHFGSVGVNRLNKCRKKELLITSSKGLVTNSIVTHVISLIGVFSRSLDVFFKDIGRPYTRNDYEKNFNKLKNFNELNVLILGLGDIGKSLAKKLFELNCTVDAVSRMQTKKHFITNHYDLKECVNHLDKYDFVISLLPENEGTKNFINFNFLKNMSQNGIFVNIGRGSTLVEQDLLMALNQKLLRKAILDVSQIEPLPNNSPLYNHPNIFLTPHIAAFSPSYWPLEEELFKFNLKCFLDNNISDMKNLIKI